MQASRIAKRLFISGSLGILFLAAAVLIACGGSGSSGPPQTQFLFVADTDNGRVLVYDAPFTTGQSASVVLGQASFTSFSAPNPPTAASLGEPAFLAVDRAGNLYVPDFGYCRVLLFQPPFTTGMNATLAIGAPNLTTAGCSTTASATNVGSAVGVAIDSTGNLWVADASNNRILKYPAPLTTGEAATVVLGQTTMSASQCNQNGTPSASTLCFPEGLAFDASGDLWVSDTQNNRVLMYPAANLVTGGTATVELGQPAAAPFNSISPNNGGTSATSLSIPEVLAFDAAGNLWVADSANNRVLMYAGANLGINGAAASLELGQPAATAFTSNTANNPAIGPSTLAHPLGVAFDSSGRVFVTDAPIQANNRTLVFVPPFTNGMNATLVLGQADFVTGTANTGGESAATQAEPSGIATAP